MTKSLPVFRSLEVKNFGLYPGRDRTGRLKIEFFAGLTLVVGANGLGKTTLIALLFRMITGPYDIPQLRPGSELGFRRLEATPISASRRRMFAARVSDHAESATARLDFRLGTISVSIERNLSNLALQIAQVGDTVCRDENSYQSQTTNAASLGSFGDFILMLRYLVFYFEDRRQLVWDPSAQRQLLRMLFLPADLAQRWTAMERSILQKDSRMRNFQAVVGNAETDLAADLGKRSHAVPLRAELDALDALQEPDRERLQQLEALTNELDHRRHQARLSNMHVKQEREDHLRTLERAKLLAIEARFPGRLETGRYIITHLLSEENCLVCGSHVPPIAIEFAQRLASNRCIVCNSTLEQSENIVDAREVADRRMAQAEKQLGAASRQLAASNIERESADSEFNRHTRETTELRSKIAGRSARLSEILDLLPPSEATLRDQRAELGSIRGRLESMKLELADERSTFRDFVAKCTDDLLASSNDIVAAFEKFAGEFLSEHISLTWTPRTATVGQGGERIPFPAFELNMSGSDFIGTVRRTGPDDVSESQREFIDLSFRMALMKGASSTSAGLVIDTPEASLDAVFARRAGEILIRFSEVEGNTVVVTSNLVEGNLLPTLINGVSSTSERRDRLVDLFDVAQPTAAVSANKDDYDALRNSLFQQLT